MKYNHKALGKQIKFYRELNALTQKQLSDKIGNHDIFASSISEIENGKSDTISFERLARIASALDVSMNTLLRDSLAKYHVAESSQPIANEIIKVIELCDDPLLLQYYSDIINYFVEK